jgi:hypothetical protein
MFDLFFQKRTKSIVPLSERPGRDFSGEDILLFPEKEAKSVVPLRGRFLIETGNRLVFALVK